MGLKESVNAFYKLFKPVEVARVGIDVEALAVAVKEKVRGIVGNFEVKLIGSLLCGRQVIVNHVLAQYIVFFDNIFPRGFVGAVGQIDEHHIVGLHALVEFLAMLQCCFAGSAPRSPYINEDEFALMGLDDFLENLFAIAQLG